MSSNPPSAPRAARSPTLAARTWLPVRAVTEPARQRISPTCSQGEPTDWYTKEGAENCDADLGSPVLARPYELLKHPSPTSPPRRGKVSSHTSASRPDRSAPRA